MTIHEFGQSHDEVVVLVHPSVVMWDYFEYVIPLMQEQYHLIVPALPGYDTESRSDFTSVEEIAEELASWLTSHNHSKIECIYGCSMGGAVVTRFLADRRVKVRSAVIDGGITPYQLPWIVTRLIAIRDFLLISMGKVGGLNILKKAFSTDDYTEEDLQYIVRVLRHMSPKTIWRTFESCNNYAMPEKVQVDCGHIEYWYAKAEEKDRKGDIAYMRKHLPQTVFRVFEDIGHGGLAALKPELLAKELTRAMGQNQAV
ncbi:MAG: alpha/beta hydrolase [Clostridia bacterium]|nr:alpha/beta hydrolase [Clostridia bacterium]